MGRGSSSGGMVTGEAGFDVAGVVDAAGVALPGVGGALEAPPDEMDSEVEAGIGDGRDCNGGSSGLARVKPKASSWAWARRSAT